ncbi:MAG: NAD(P)H-quinone oxidoreductase [Gammaproteobacteria bacterium]|nr:NAD(P)H-quinone oxidoreductase [Gammaproteobacteria bacterium]
MKFVDYQEPCDANGLNIRETNKPTPANGQVLIKVDAAGLNRLDILQRRGFYPPPPGASTILGVEVAGTITEITENCNGLKIGDEVCALLSGGGYAEYVAADAVSCLPVPKGLDMIQAASLPEALFTVWSNIMDVGHLLEGQSILIHGGASGIGTAAIQLAKCHGATVITTARNEDKCRFCEEIGADLTINYQNQDFVQECLDFTSGKGVNLILDMVGGDYLDRNIKAAAIDGKIILIAAIGGIKATLNILALMQKRILLTGTTLRSREPEFKSQIAKNLLLHVWPLIEAGKIRPVIHEVFPLFQAKNAHLLMESNKHCGKIVLNMAC